MGSWRMKALSSPHAETRSSGVLKREQPELKAVQSNVDFQLRLNALTTRDWLWPRQMAVEDSRWL